MSLQLQRLGGSRTTHAGRAADHFASRSSERTAPGRAPSPRCSSARRCRPGQAHLHGGQPRGQHPDAAHDAAPPGGQARAGPTAGHGRRPHRGARHRTGRARRLAQRGQGDRPAQRLDAGGVVAAARRPRLQQPRLDRGLRPALLRRLLPLRRRGRSDRRSSRREAARLDARPRLPQAGPGDLPRRTRGRAVQRKPEATQEWLEQRRQQYLALADVVPAFVVVDVDRPLEPVTPMSSTVSVLSGRPLPREDPPRQPHRPAGDRLVERTYEVRRPTGPTPSELAPRPPAVTPWSSAAA